MFFTKWIKINKGVVNTKYSTFSVRKWSPKNYSNHMFRPSFYDYIDTLWKFLCIQQNKENEQGMNLSDIRCSSPSTEWSLAFWCELPAFSVMCHSGIMALRKSSSIYTAAVSTWKFFPLAILSFHLKWERSNSSSGWNVIIVSLQGVITVGHHFLNNYNKNNKNQAQKPVNVPFCH